MEAMRERVEKRELPGLVTVVADGSAEVVEAYGTYAFGSDEPMRRETVFRIASVTKPMLAAVTMMLVEDGTFGLGDPVDRWLPELAVRRVLRRLDGPIDDTVAAERPITVEDLLTFRMGHGLIVEPFDPAYPIVQAGRDLRLTLAQPDPRTPYEPDAWIRVFGSLPLMDQPGTVWRYNTGALVLGVLVARAAGRPLGDVMRDRLFGPLGMDDTGFWRRDAHLPGYYLAGALQDVSPEQEWNRPPVFPSGAGGLLSTVDDILRFARMMQGGTRLLSAESIVQMTTDHLTPEQAAGGGVILDGRGWGYGMAVATSGRYGWDGGSGTSWFNDPATGRIGILLSQSSDVLWNGTLPEFTRLVLE